MPAKFNLLRSLSTALRSREWGTGTLSSPSKPAAELPLVSPATASFALGRSRGRAVQACSWGFGEGPAAHAESPAPGPDAPAKLPAAPSRRHHLSARFATTVIAMVATSLALAAAPAPASALSKHTYSTAFTGEGTSALSAPTDVAVDQATHDVYVADPAANRVEKFTPTGEFILMFGMGVDQMTGGDVCTAASGDTCQPGALGTSPGAFASHSHLFLAVDNSGGPSAGDIYVGDRGDSLVSKFDSSGHLISAWGSDGRLDGSTSGDIPFFGIREIDEPPGEPSRTARGLKGIAVDPSGDLLVIAANAKGQFYRFAEDGAFRETFYTGTAQIQPAGLAVDPTEEIGYVSGGVIQRESLKPPTSFRRENERLAPVGGPSPVGIAFDRAARDLYYVDAADHDVAHYAPSCEPELGPFPEEDTGCAPAETFGAADLSQPQGLAVDEASQAVYVADPTAHRVAVFTAVPYLPAATPSARPQTPTEELLTAEVDPAGAGGVNDCRFEYIPRSALLNEVQVLTLSPAVTGGTFTLTFEGLTSGVISIHDLLNPSLNYIANAFPVLVKVGDSPDHRRHTIEFAGSLLKVNVPPATGDFSGLTPAGATATLTTETDGGGGWASAAHAECFPAPPYLGSPSTVTAHAPGLTYATPYLVRVVTENATGSSTSFTVPFTTLPEPPQITAESVAEAYAENVKVQADVNPGGGDTTYHVQYITQQQFEAHEWAQATSSPELDAGSARTPQSVDAPLNHLTPGTTYRYRVIAANANQTTTGTAQTFTTLPFLPTDDTCSNAHVRQQTSATQLLDCRAYELVSAADAGGYDVESSLIPGQIPYGGFPEVEGRLLYGVHHGGIPGTNHPTNRGVDPYVATRGREGWSTEYVGVSATDPFAGAPFSSVPSAADSNLETFSFGGPEGCSPCFADGYTGIPVHLPSGELVQGMIAGAGVPTPPSSATPDGHIAAPLSANGEHFIFGSTSLFAPGGNDSTGDVSIYDRNLRTGETHVVSNAPDAAAPPEALLCLQGQGKCDSTEGNPDGISELGISQDGSHILLGQKVTTDAQGNVYWHLYMDVDDAAKSIDLTPGAGEGVLFDGMTADGSRVFFSSKEHLTHEDESHSGADIFVWAQATNALTLITKGNSAACNPFGNSGALHWNTVGSEENCGALAIGGGGGVSSADGTIYFLSPEQLAGSGHGTLDAPNLYRAGPGDGYTAHYVTTLESALTAHQPPALTRIPGHGLSASFTKATALAVENEHGSLYVLDAAANTVEKLDSSGHLVESWGDSGHLSGPSASGTGDLSAARGTGDTSAASGAGDLTAGSATVKNLATAQGTFAIGQTISGSGIESGTTITAIPGPGELELSAPATEELTVSELTAASRSITAVNTSSGAFAVGQEISGAGIPEAATVTAVSPGELELSAPATEEIAADELSAGSKTITSFITATGAFALGQTIEGAGIPAGTTITALNPGSLEISRPAEATATAVLLTAKQSFSEAFFGIIYPSGLAVDQSSGDLYVPDIEHNVVDRFSPSGEYLSQIQVANPVGVAIDNASHDIYVAGAFGTVSIFEPSGNPVEVFSTGHLLGGIGVDSAGTVYVTLLSLGGQDGTEVYDSSGHHLRTLDSNVSQSVTVDPSTDDAYVDEGGRLAVYGSSGQALGSLGSGQLTGSVGLAAEAGGGVSPSDHLEPGGALYATNSGGTGVSVFVPSFAPSPLIDNPAVLDSLGEADVRHTADFQLTPGGRYAVFPSTLALAGKGEKTGGHTALYRYDAAAEVLDCVSCAPTGAPSAGDAGLAPDGLSLTDDGRVFFDAADPLVLADTDNRRDVYQSSQVGLGNCREASPAFNDSTGNCLALISAGTSAFDSGLLSATTDATDAYFFTRDSLTPSDTNGPTMKIYDARRLGGFPYTFPAATCKASDECHGASSPSPPPIEAGSEAGSPRNYEKCKKGFVRKHGHCVKKPKRHRRHRRANHKRGGEK